MDPSEISGLEKLGQERQGIGYAPPTQAALDEWKSLAESTDSLVGIRPKTLLKIISEVERLTAHYHECDRLAKSVIVDLQQIAFTAEESARQFKSAMQKANRA